MAEESPPTPAAAHTCHAEGCEVAIEPGLLFCRRHFQALPEPLRASLSEHYRRGQWWDGHASPEYALASVQARIWLAEAEGNEVPGYLLSRKRILERDLGHPGDAPPPKLRPLPERDEGSQEHLFGWRPPAEAPPPPPARPPAQPALFDRLPAGASAREVEAPPPGHPIPEPQSAELAAALLLLRTGAQAFHQAYDALKGRDDPARARNLRRDFGPARTGGALTPRELGLTLNAALRAQGAKPLRGQDLERGLSESPEQHLQRVARLLEASVRDEVPVIVFLDTLVAEPGDEGRGRWRRHAWSVGLIAAVGEAPTSGDAAWLTLMEPLSERRSTALLHAETGRPFSALCGPEADARWRGESPLLVVTGPSLPLQGEPPTPGLRAVTGLRYAIGRW